MRAALLVLCAVAACAHAATIARDVSVLPAVPIPENERKLPQEPQEPEVNNSSDEELVQQTIPADQLGNDLRTQNFDEVHIPVEIVQEAQPVLKSTASEGQKESDNEVLPAKPEETPDEDDEAETPKPSFIQQGIQTLQALQQAATLTVQNVLKPQSDEKPGSNFLEQSFHNLQNSFQSGIQSINKTVNNILHPSPESQSDETTSSNQNIITTIQHNFQNSLAQLNQTFQDFIHPSEGSKPELSPANEQNVVQIESGLKQLNEQFEAGLQSASNGIKAITFLKEDSAVTEAPAPFNPVNAFQQFIQGWQQTFTNNIQNLNTTVQNFIQGQQQQSDEAGNKPNIVQQGIQNVQNGFQNFQNFFTGQKPPQAQSDDGTTPSKPTNIFIQSLQNFQNLLSGQQQGQAAGNSSSPVNVIQQGLQNLQQNFQSGLNTLQNSFKPQIGAEAVVPAAAAETTSSKKSVVGAVKDTAVEAADSPRKKGGGSGDNNDISGGRVEEQNGETKPEEVPESNEDVKPAERVITE